MAYVNIHYGPYEVAGVVKHRTGRLQVLKAQLEMRGHTVGLIPSPHWDRVEVEVGGRRLFRCDIHNLECTDDGEDVVAGRAVYAVEDNLARVKPPPRPAPAKMFSMAYFQRTVEEAFRRMKIHAYITECFDRTLAYVEILENVHLREEVRQKLAAEFQGLEGGLINNLLQREFVEDLSREKVESYLSEEMLATLPGPVPSGQMTEFTNETIRKAICKSTLDLQVIVDAIVRRVVDDIVANVVRGAEGETDVFGLVEEAVKRLENISDHVYSKHSAVSELLEKIPYNESWYAKQDALYAGRESKHTSDVSVASTPPYRPPDRYSLDSIETQDYIRNLVARSAFRHTTNLEDVVEDVIVEAVRAVMWRLGMIPNQQREIYRMSQEAPQRSQTTTAPPHDEEQHSGSVYVQDTWYGWNMSGTSLGSASPPRAQSVDSMLVGETRLDSTSSMPTGGALGGERNDGEGGSAGREDVEGSVRSGVTDPESVRNFMRDVLLEALERQLHGVQGEVEDIVNMVVDQAMEKFRDVIGD